ncbi:predicted protein [Naegleria gruberi]|uniref:Predicted protein n=1 Tax=Naegleria gruberi TaxID=5762 RepID=D2W4D4_NAEGR|nr:uncharacterized protein NAEGRDRAFT_76266 [Naegleria gruberi]EFC36068.1 predicted protein [Naegleria gruberi]|eukprot:XP_002668812.1 predicted protein [Naegleria gruberi strain NEG-M]
MRQDKTTFNPDNYCLVYEEVMTCQETRNIFKEFLKENMAEEPLLYLDECEKYKVEYAKLKEKFHGLSLMVKRSSSVGNVSDLGNETSGKEWDKNQLTKLFVNLKGIIDEFIVEEATKELNLSSVRQWTIMEWQIIEAMMNGFEQDSSNLELSNNLYRKLDINVLFEKVDLVVMIDLKMDQFPRFIRSNLARKFLLEKGEHFT